MVGAKHTMGVFWGYQSYNTPNICNCLSKLTE